MNIFVLVKQTFDTEAKIVIKDGNIIDDNVEFIMNPYDEYAVEEAIRIKETHGGEVTVVTIGPERAERVLRTALAVGADKAIIVDDSSLSGDEFTTSKVLASIAKREAYDIILAGYMAIDDSSAQVGPRLAEELNITCISTITKLELDGNMVRVEKDVEGDKEIIESSLPILVTTQQGLNEPRYPTLPGIMKAKKKPLQRLNLDDLGIDRNEIRAKTVCLENNLPPKKDPGRILAGEIQDQVKELFELLRNEAQVI